VIKARFFTVDRNGDMNDYTVGFIQRKLLYTWKGLKIFRYLSTCLMMKWHSHRQYTGSVQ